MLNYYFLPYLLQSVVSEKCEVIYKFYTPLAKSGNLLFAFSVVGPKFFRKKDMIFEYSDERRKIKTRGKNLRKRF